MKKCVALDTE